MFELNLAHTSILELLEKAAEKNELIHVRARQRRVGKTSALIQFARENNYTILTKKTMERSYQQRHPDLNIIGYADGSELDGLSNVVCDEGIPRDTVKRLHKLGILLTGFILENDYDNTGIDQAVPLIQIELEKLDSIPRVFYKGEKITNRIAVDFEWRTAGPEKLGSSYIRIKHGESFNGKLAVETKELAFGEKAYE
ncbi:hypothetical protein [Bacillus haynesii]|uniref:hypothetical protein n=1 Tax=Bacillus haynesii TaxID=1925021 RepID=UPI00227E8518|nr:hypothetical protein [Bacillus haynesii]MCY7912264.1 hypothetical protein [Bacillus haynesii]MCY7928094.1 hypothetical protein [Bacillus haynesii]MCY8772391.1 hypothetical protein [Bacillus haynesii]MEC0789467.1 hypothetical protein [Bacillus haynesii]MEC1654768.1 hypothetical protein [Bacillus haynesii]